MFEAEDIGSFTDNRKKWDHFQVSISPYVFCIFVLFTVGMWNSPCNQDSDCLEDSHMWCSEVPRICGCQPGFIYNAIIKICEPGMTPLYIST